MIMPRKRSEYRVWRKNRSGDQRATQGHYILATSEEEAIDAVLSPGDRAFEFDALIWKEAKGDDIYPMRHTPESDCFIETGDPNMCRRKRRR